MKSTHTPAVTSLALCLATLIVVPTPARAGGDHDHGPAAPVTTGPALPRFAAESDLFELVGVLKGQQITLYLDRAADNQPVTEAQIELEIGGRKFQAAKLGTDTFEVLLGETPKPSVLPITATVTAGADADLLAGEFDIHEAAQAHEAAHAHSWKEYAGWAAGAVAVLAVVLTVLQRVGRRLRSSPQTRAGGAA